MSLSLIIVYVISISMYSYEEVKTIGKKGKDGEKGGLIEMGKGGIEHVFA